MHYRIFLIVCYTIVTIYKSSIRTQQDQANVVFDEPNNSISSNWIESVQYNAALEIKRS